MLRLGIVGCGGMGRHHAGKFSNMPSVRVVAVCDIIEDKARKLAETVGSKYCTDFHRLLDEVDAICVCTEPFNRVPIISAAAQAGKDIFCEKPIALNLTDADEMVRLTDRAGVKFMLGYVLHFTQPFKLIRDTFASGQLGQLVNCWTRRYMPMDPRGRWYGQQDKSGGVALDFGSHDIDWLMWIGGEVRTVFAETIRVRPGVEADEHCQAMLAFVDGGMGAADVTWWDAVAESSIGVVGTTGSMSADKSGTVRMKMAGEREVVAATDGGLSVDPAGNIGRKTEGGKIETVAQAGETIQEHFVHCIEQDVQPQVTGRDARTVLRTVLAMGESARTGKSVNLGHN